MNFTKVTFPPVSTLECTETFCYSRFTALGCYSDFPCMCMYFVLMWIGVAVYTVFVENYNLMRVSNGNVHPVSQS